MARWLGGWVAGWPGKTVIEFGVRSSEFGVRSSEFGVQSSEFGVRTSVPLCLCAWVSSDPSPYKPNDRSMKSATPGASSRWKTGIDTSNRPSVTRALNEGSSRHIGRRPVASRWTSIFHSASRLYPSMKTMSWSVTNGSREESGRSSVTSRIMAIFRREETRTVSAPACVKR